MKTLRKAALLIAVTFTLGGLAEPVATQTTTAEAKSAKVWIAPHHGKSIITRKVVGDSITRGN